MGSNKRYVSKEEEGVIADCLRRKMTATEIAQVINRSRGSVAGIVWRSEELRKIGFAQKPKRATDVSKWETAKQRRAEKLAGVDFGRPSLRKGKPLLELTSSACRFPLWEDDAAIKDKLFCAEMRSPDSSYCEFHRKLCAGAVRRVA